MVDNKKAKVIFLMLKYCSGPALNYQVKLVYCVDNNMSRKKIIIISLITAIVVVAGVLGVYFFISQKNKVVSPLSKMQASLTPTPVELATWTDQAEFSFQYPKDLTINPHDEDQDNYAHVELTSAKHQGNIIVWVKDTKSPTIADWVAKGKITNAIDSSLGTEEAKKVLSEDASKKITISAIHNGYLYQIEVSLADDYWKNIYDEIVSTFTFTSGDKVSPAAKSSSGTTEDGDSSYDEEEVIE